MSMLISPVIAALLWLEKVWKVGSAVCPNTQDLVVFPPLEDLSEVKCLWRKMELIDCCLGL